MPQEFIIVIFAVIAAFVLFQLYNVLGKKVGRQPEDNAKKLEAELAAKGAAAPPPTAGPARGEPPLAPEVAQGVAALKARDPAFDVSRFLIGARSAYETIVRAYASGDRTALKPLLASPVMESFETGIVARETRAESETVEFVHPPRADLEAIEVEGDRARAKVRFLAELSSRLKPAEGDETTEERRTAEHWTFERAVGSNDPNWVLARVEAASA
ncbi:TIM44-related membrane protein TimA [Brevundimonas lutea]|uniref:TIM44-related membrane protein TimA n=1 Tax=Brevundimonas lutea TaxID=2293980 RepID=UPI000F0224F2|nr:TIM44-related membrane protein TimA [Brevundimonas lutea]